ncbi:MAG: ankyrin repeat domain-containing protein [Legionellaceae bacterium]|nr:ankyrin repeat domain-containing protein [Legionellaceae bacterium]
MKFLLGIDTEHTLVAFTINSAGEAVIRTDEDILARLKSLPEDVDFNYFDGRANSLLFYLAESNCVQSARYLLRERNADANLTVKNNFTAAHVAARNGHFEVLKVILEESTRIRLELQNFFGDTALLCALGDARKIMAAQAGEDAGPDRLMETVTLLVSKMTAEELAITNEDGYDALSFALMMRHTPSITLLLSAKCPVSQGCAGLAAQLVSDISAEREGAAESNLVKSSVFGLKNNQDKQALLEAAGLIVEAFAEQTVSEVLSNRRFSMP